MTRDELIECVRTAGEDIAKNAEDIVGSNMDKLMSIDIWIRLPRDDKQCTYEVEHEYAVIPPSMLNFVRGTSNG